MLGQYSGVISPHQNKEKFRNNTCPQPDFEVQSNNVLTWNLSEFYIWWNLIHPSVFSCNWKWRNTLSAHFWCPWNYSQL